MYGSIFSPHKGLAQKVEALFDGVSNFPVTQALNSTPQTL